MLVTCSIGRAWYMILHMHEIINKQQNFSQLPCLHSKHWTGGCSAIYKCCFPALIDLVHFFLLFWARELHACSQVVLCVTVQPHPWLQTTTLKLSAQAQQGPFTEYRIQRDIFTIIIILLTSYVHLLINLHLGDHIGNVHLCTISWHYLYDTTFARYGWTSS